MRGRSLSFLVALAINAVVGAGAILAQAAPFDRNVIVLDPAHGGTDTGAHLSQQTQEKDVTLAFAARLRPLLAARGFNVAVTRTGDLDAGPPDQRAELANRTHAVACLVLHASAGPTGVVLGTSALGTALSRSPKHGKEDHRSGVSWDHAQEAYVTQSDRLANEVGTALSRANLSATLTRVMMRPLDSLTCPVISIELGTLSGGGIAPILASDETYQQRVAESLADALVLWRKDAQPAEYVSASWPGSR